jgi:hypothetical protein
VTLRYFTVAGANPEGLLGQATPEATHLIKVGCECATGVRDGMSVFGTDYATRDGTCVRDYIHVEDLAKAHVMALDYMSGGGESQILNCGYGRGCTVREVIEVVKRLSGVDFPVTETERRAGDPERVARCDGRERAHAPRGASSAHPPAFGHGKPLACQPRRETGRGQAAGSWEDFGPKSSEPVRPPMRRADCRVGPGNDGAVDVDPCGVRLSRRRGGGAAGRSARG